MAWASCNTHGPIQDARATINGAGTVVRLTCKCGLDCAPYTPEAFVEHDELKTLAETDTQPVEGHDALEELTFDFDEAEDA